METNTSDPEYRLTKFLEYLICLIFYLIKPAFFLHRNLFQKQKELSNGRTPRGALFNQANFEIQPPR